MSPISLEGLVDSIRNEQSFPDTFMATTLDLTGVGSYVMDNDDLKKKTPYKEMNKAQRYRYNRDRRIKNQINKNND